MYLKLEYIDGKTYVDGTVKHFASRSSGLVGDDEPYFKWHWNGTLLFAETDRYGLYPGFYAVKKNTIVIGETLEEVLLASGSTSFDLDALAVFLRLGYFLAEDTPFLNIRVMPPGGRLVWKNGKVGVESHQPSIQQQKAPICRDEAAATFVELFRKSMERRQYSTDYMLPLSGGRDSRHILFESIAQGSPPELAVTMGKYADKLFEDMQIASQVASAVGISHHIVPRASNYYKDERIKNRRTHYLSDEHAWAVSLAEYLGCVAKPMYDGIAGDVLSAGLYLTEPLLKAFRSHDTSVVANLLLQYHGFPSQQLLIPEAAAAMSLDVAHRRLKRELAGHFDKPDPVASFFFFNRTRREVATCPLALYPDNVSVRFPYLDAGLFDFLMGIPAEEKLDKSLHDRAIALNYPQFRHLPYEQKGVRDESLWKAYKRHLSRGFVFALMHKPKGALLNRRYLVPRLLKAQINGHCWWLRPIEGIYLTQLEELVDGVK